MNLKAWRFYFKFYRDSYTRLFFCLFLSCFQTLLVLPITFLVRYTFDSVIPSGNVNILLLVGAVIFLMNVVHNTVTLWTRFLTLNVTKKAIRDLRDELLTRCCACSRSYYTETDRSKLHTKLVQDSERTDWMSNALIPLAMPSFVIVLGLTGILFYLNWKLFLLVFCFVPILFLVNRKLRKKIKSRVQDFHRSFEKFSKGTLFLLQMMDLTRLSTAEDYEMQRQRKNLEQVRITSGSMAWLNALYHSIQNGIVVLSGVLILIVGGISVTQGDMTLGSLVSFYVALALLHNYLRVFLSTIPDIIAGNESLTTLYNFINLQDTVPYSGRKIISFQGRIQLESVFFAYKKNNILQDINFTITPNTMKAIVGANGVGKTTIIQLILGFYRPLKGHIFADGISYDELDLRHFRKSLGVVMQDPILFPGTIRENITYGFPSATHEDLVRASHLATSHEFVEKLPKGYDTQIGESGVLLSGGQRQRIAIARALFRRPKILILDEPTNHLDRKTISRLMNNLQNLAETPAILTVTQDMYILDEIQDILELGEGGRLSPLKSGRFSFKQDQEK